MTEHATQEHRATLLLQPPWLQRMTATSSTPSFYMGPLFADALKALDYAVTPLAPPPHPRLLADGWRFGRQLRQAEVAVVFQGYGLIAAARARMFQPTPKLIVHSWKFPGIGGHRLRSRIMDQLLLAVMKKSSLVVLNSQMQQREATDRYPGMATLWLPVVTDIDWFTPGPAQTDVLTRHDLSDGQFLLCVGDIDRDEQLPAKLARRLGRSLVRVTRDPATAARARKHFDDSGFREAAVLINVPWDQLRDLYRRCWALLTAPTVSFHPAGLTTLTEGMACGAPVLFPSGPTVEGHMDDGVDGLQFESFDADAIVSVARRLDDPDFRGQIVRGARARCERDLNIRSAAVLLADKLRELGLDRSDNRR